jgi:UDP-N-acetylmuramyl pentapeptide synthase
MTLINDTWNSNPESLEASLSVALTLAEGRPLAVVLGAMLELGAHSQSAHNRMGAMLGDMPLEAIVLVGEEARPAIGQRPDALFLSEANEQSLREAAEHVRGEGRVVLVKGSRSLRLERLVEVLRIESQANVLGRTMKAKG